MLVRRVLAALLMLCTLHLSLLGGSEVCATHARSGAHDRMGMAPHAASVGVLNIAPHANMNTVSNEMAKTTSSAVHTDDGYDGLRFDIALPAPANDTDNKPCEAPAGSNCCRAVISCSALFAENRQTTNVSSPIVRAVMIAQSVNTPRSEIVSPDPPPPKA